MGSSQKGVASYYRLETSGGNGPIRRVRIAHSKCGHFAYILVLKHESNYIDIHAINLKNG